MRRSRRHGKRGFFQGLGFLPGGNQSFVQGVNADGTVVVGFSGVEHGNAQAFRWTAASGMVGLGFLPGGNVSAARGVNADGTVVVGGAVDASKQRSSLPLDGSERHGRPRLFARIYVAERSPWRER